MDNQQLVLKHPEIETKMKVICFFDKYGLNPTKDAFNVSRSSIYLWKQKLKASNGRLFSLINQSRKPHNTRRMYIDTNIYNFIESLRKKYPTLSKDKIKPLLDEYCLTNDLTSVSVSKIGKIIKRNNFFFYLPKRKKSGLSVKKKRLFGYSVADIGDLIQIDTIVKFKDGIKRYILTAIDIKSKFAFSYAYKNHSSRSAKDFIQKLIKVSPYSIKAIQTDNGSEFLDYADKEMETNGIVHFFTYPKSPKMNAYIERFNRTIQEEHINHNKDTLAYNLNQFNNNLMEYLLFYNTKRIHHSLNNIIPMDYIIKNIKKSNMYGTDTQSWWFLTLVIESNQPHAPITI